MFDEWIRILAGLALVALSFTWTLASIERGPPQGNRPPAP